MKELRRWCVISLAIEVIVIIAFAASYIVFGVEDEGALGRAMEVAAIAAFVGFIGVMVSGITLVATWAYEV